jgi:flagellar biosynthesis component FlhA
MAEAVKTVALPRAPLMEWVVPVAAVGLIFVMLVPLPSFLLDILLAASLTASILVLLSAMHILRPAQFSVFPSLLLLLTLFRLSLNLASSRRILLHGNEGAAAAGNVIQAFGQFVVGGNYVVGFVLFLALIAIQYLVVSHGAVRTAEVTARFTLDALPGKQMAIDADLNAGLIDESQARARREQISHEAEFYGAMDGAARFNQRDALATVLITGINIIAGFLIGVFQLGIPFREALKTYTVLTVGDGLVTMIPSLLVSMAGGIVVTRASSGSTLSTDLGKQLLSGHHAGAGLDSRTAQVLFPSSCGVGWNSRVAHVAGFAAGRRAGKRQGKRKENRIRRRLVEARRTGPRSGIRAGSLGRPGTRRTNAASCQSPARQSGPAAGIHFAAGAHHR